ncbi:hypothetical protein [Roseovarius arcticus]|uniref:hypothetical protein n=1 Tax=Roseovarius arcticus TaxID=2547404 RepID=UPI001486CA3A|nr:hypothetical protein [Roseovarius arcticus]
MKTFMIAVICALLPTMSLAEGCNHGKSTQVISCAAGTSYDADAKSCVPVSS